MLQNTNDTQTLSQTLVLSTDMVFVSIGCAYSPSVFIQIPMANQAF